MNQQDQIDTGLALIYGSLGGNSWTDETVLAYRQQFSTIGDGGCFIRACQAVVKSWTQIAKPPPAVIYEAYKAEIMRRELHQEPRAIEEPGREIPAWRDGLAIARQAYEAECARQDREPNDWQPPSMLARCYEPREDRSGLRRLA
jgi:hypothetical protein